jgi:thiol-disulfide isomerase/thioredoxin
MFMNTSSRSVHVGLLFFLLLYAARVGAAPAEPDATNTPHNLTVLVTDKDTGELLPGAAVTVKAEEQEWTGITDEAGLCVIQLISPPKDWLAIEATHRGYVRDSISGKPEKLLRLKRPHTLRLEKGVPIGGVIVDDSGTPVEGVQVTFSLQVRNIHVKTTTDGEGRWELSVPEGEVNPAWQLQHPDFPLSTTFSWINITGDLRAGQHRHTIVRGQRIEGCIVDEAGNAVSGAFAIRGHVDFDTYDALRKRIDSGEVRNAVITDSAGNFSIPVESDTKAVVVCADGFAPARIEVQDDAGPQRIVLGKGGTWRGRVRDASGAAVEGARVRCYQWSESGADRMMMRPYEAVTNAEGAFEMACLPATGQLDMSVDKESFFGTSLPLLALDQLPVELTLYPASPLKGRVFDAATGEPVKTFMVDYGFTEKAVRVASFYCHEPALTTSKEGAFSIETGLDMGEQPGSIWVRVWARDYYPTLLDPVAALDLAKGLEIPLEPGPALEGRVIMPDGTPAEGATMALVHLDELAVVEAFRLGMDYVGAPYNHTTSRKNGRFALAPSKEPAYLLALHKSGWAVRAAKEHEADGALPLSAWCTLEGQVSLEGRPAGEAVYIQVAIPMQKTWGEREPIRFSRSTTVDADGHFRIEHVPALPLKVGESRYWVMSHATDVTPQPGETLHIDIGGTHTGAVSGKIAVDDLVNPEGTFSEPWHASRRFFMAARPAGAEKEDEYANYIPLVQEEGTFTLNQLPPGEYELTVSAHENPPENACGRGTPRARATRTFTIAEGASVPLDLGSVQLERVPRVDAGDPAPAVEATVLEGGAPWVLAGELAQGKPVLLVFWATWCAPCMAEVPLLKELWETYGKTDRLRIIGLNLDWKQELAAQVVQTNGLPWPQCHAGAWGESNPVTNAYGVAYIPSNWLIGPDGNIIAARIPTDDLAKTLEEHLPAQ